MPEDPQTESTPAASQDWHAGEEIGPYHILDLIGEGGFGSVYLAEQREPIRRRVALKVVKPGMDSREVVARFEAERQALAMLDHPNVAKVFDAGMTPRGRPYFAMEHVPGVPITAYCDEHKLSVQRRLKLFIHVCHAIQHAHQKGIIHRDLKPSNILVTLIDNEPVPKVIDFGIAKATSQQLTEKTLYTETGRMIGTPEYMSPEQAGTSGLDVDTRTDIYSLGVLLYELLSGTLPFDPATLRHAGYENMMRAIKEDEPPKLSSRVASTDTQTAAMLRRADTRTLLRELRGDLDWITMRAMEKDRSRRYETANGLAMDIQRYLDHEAIRARPPSTAYRISRFVRKHRFGVAAGSAVVMALVAGLVGTWLGWVEADEQRAFAEEQRAAAVKLSGELESAKTLAEKQRDEARNQKARAEAISGFMGDLLGFANPDVSRDPNMTLRQLLERAGAGVGRALRGQPVAEARVRTEIGKALATLGVLEPANDHLQRAVELLENEPAPPNEELYEALWARWLVLYDLGKGWRPVLDRTHAVRSKLLGTAHATLVKDLLTQSVSDYKHAETRKLHQRLVRITENEMESGDPRRVWMADCLAVCGWALAFLQKQDDVGIRFVEDAIDIYESELGETHTRTIGAFRRQYEIYKRTQRFAEVEKLVRESLVRLEKSLPSGHWYIGFCKGMHGMSLTKLGRYEEASEALESSFEVLGGSLGADHGSTVNALKELVILHDLWPKGDPAKRSVYRERYFAALARSTTAPTLDVVRIAFGKKHDALLSVLDRLDRELKARSDAIEAATAQVFAKLREEIPDEKDPRAALVGGLLTKLSHDYILADGKREHALPLDEAGARICEAADAGFVDYAQGRLAWTLMNEGRHERARDLVEKSLASGRKRFEENDPRVAVAKSRAGYIRYRGGEKSQEVEDLLRQAFRVHLDLYGPTHANSMWTLGNLVIYYAFTGQADNAVTTTRQYLTAEVQKTAEANRASYLGYYLSILPGLKREDYLHVLPGVQRGVEDDPAKAIRHTRLALLHYRLGRFEEALRSLETAERLHDKDRPEDRFLWTQRAMTLHRLDRHDEARQAMEKAVRLVADPERVVTPQLRALVDEAKELLGGGAKSGR